MDEKLSTIYNAILEGDVTGAKDGVQTALLADLQPENILSEDLGHGDLNIIKMDQFHFILVVWIKPNFSSPILW